MSPHSGIHVGIILLTYERTEYARRTIESVCQHMQYDGGRLRWYVADDGSSKQHFDEVRGYVCDYGGDLFSFHQTDANKCGYGVNANRAWETFRAEGIDITFWLEDDWVMTRDYDITPHVKTMLNYKVGMIRTTYIPLNITMKPCHYSSQYYFELQKDGLYTYSGNPHLKHIDFAKSYGMLPEDRNPGETEIAYDHIVRHTEGMPILVPADIHDPPFVHIGEEKSYE